MYVELPDINQRIHPTVLRASYSVLRRVEAVGLTLFLSRPVTSGRDFSSNAFYQRTATDVAKTHRCYWLGFMRPNFH